MIDRRRAPVANIAKAVFRHRTRGVGTAPFCRQSYYGERTVSYRNHKRTIGVSAEAREKGTVMQRILVAMGLAAIGLAPMTATAGTEHLPATARTAHHCFGEVPTVVGTHGMDDLSGDVVVGLGDSDDLDGRLVCGNSGDDFRLVGESVNGGPGNDVDVIAIGGVGIGGPGNDELYDGGSFTNVGQTFWGGDGDDLLSLDEENSLVEPDVFYGGLGNDEADSSDAQPTLQFGEEGNDDLAGGFGRDKLYGGLGDDFLRSVRSSLDDNVPDVLRGGGGFDTCILDPGDKAISCEDVTVRGSMGAQGDKR